MVRTRLKSNDEETIVKPSIVSSYKKKVKPILNVVKPPVLPPSLLTKNKRTVRFKDFSGPGRKKMRRNATLNDLRREIIKRDTGIDIDLKSFTCSICGKIFADPIGYHHLQAIHNITIPFRESKFKNPHLVPDPKNEDNWCCTCEKTFPSRRKFLRHLNMMHLIYVQRFFTPCGSPTDIFVNHATPERGKKLKEKNIYSDDTYCSTCDIKFFDRKTFFRHLSDSHSLFSDSRKNSINSLREHFKQLKNDGSTRTNKNIAEGEGDIKRIQKRRSRGFKSADVVPSDKVITIDKENSIDKKLFRDYCSNCRRFFVCYQSYQKHLRLVHHLALKPKRKACNKNKKKKDSSDSEEEEEEDKEPSNNNELIDGTKYCSACKTESDTPQEYYRHLLVVHKAMHNILFDIKTSPPKGIMGISPESKSRYRCLPHQLIFKRKNDYVDHLRQLHEIAQTEA